MATEKEIKSVSIRSEDRDKRRLCDLILKDDGRVYLTDVEMDEKRGKKNIQYVLIHIMMN